EQEVAHGVLPALRLAAGPGSVRPPGGLGTVGRDIRPHTLAPEPISCRSTLISPLAGGEQCRIPTSGLVALTPIGETAAFTARPLTRRLPGVATTSCLAHPRVCRSGQNVRR